MADAYKRLTAAGLQLAAAAAAIYTAPSAPGTGVVIRHMSAINTDNVDRTFSLWAGGTTNPFLITEPAIKVVAGGKWESVAPIALSPGEVVNGAASAASVVNFRMDGDETS